MAQANVNINIRMDKRVKEEFEIMCNELGFNMSTAFNIFARAFINNHGMPFDVKLPTPNKETLMAMRDIEEGKNLNGPFNTVDELMESLNAED